MLLIPIVNFAVFGYMASVIKNVVDGLDRPLPDWGDFGDHFVRGLMLFLIGVVYMLPLIFLIYLLAMTGALGRESSTLSDAVLRNLRRGQSPRLFPISPQKSAFGRKHPEPCLLEVVVEGKGVD